MTNHAAAADQKPLNPLSIAVGLLPWIVFSLVAQRLAADGVAWSALIAVAMTVAALVYGRRKHTPTQLDLYSLGLFGVLAVAGFAGGPDVDGWLFEWGRPLVGVVLGLVVLVTAWARPFTAEYARRSTPRELWTMPLFIRINRVLSATWGVALMVIGAAAVLVTAVDARAADATSPHLAELLLNWVVPIAVLAVTIWFTNSYPDRVGAGTTTAPSRLAAAA